MSSNNSSDNSASTTAAPTPESQPDGQSKGWVESVSTAIFGSGSKAGGGGGGGGGADDKAHAPQRPAPVVKPQESFRSVATAEAVTAPNTPGVAAEHAEPSFETVELPQTAATATTTGAAKPRRSVTITESRRAEDRRGRRQERQAQSQPGGTAADRRGSLDQGQASHRRSQSQGGGVRNSISGLRRSLSLATRNNPDQSVDVLREPRRSIGRRPDELDLAARDPHGAGSAKGGVERAVAFAAPYPRSGIVTARPSKWSEWIVPGPLTFGHGQWWYLTVGQSFLAAVISGAINFGVACATYNHYDKTIPVRLWAWYPVPLAGDMGVTVIIQQIVSMLLTSALVHHDLTNGPIGPLRRPWPPLLHLPSTPSPHGSWLGVKLPSEVHTEKPLYMGKAQDQSRATQYFWWFIRSFFMGSERNDLFAKGISWRQRAERFLWTAVQGFILCLVTFPWFWPISIAIVAPIYGGRNLSGTFIPAIIKLVYGAVLSLLTNPIMALLAMGAESSVRRAYPELELWQPFGGEEDYRAWLVEQHLTVDDVEIGPRGLARSSTQIRRPSRAGQASSDSHDVSAAAQPHGQGISADSSVDLEAQRRIGSGTGGGAGGMRANDAVPSGAETAAARGLAGGRPISRAITEEPESTSVPESTTAAASRRL